MGSSASCRNLHVSSKFQDTGEEKESRTVERPRKIKRGNPKSSTEHTKSVVKEEPSEAGQIRMSEELACSRCDTDDDQEMFKSKESTKKGLKSKLSKQCLYPYNDESRPAVSSDLPKTPSRYDAVNNWKTTLPHEKINGANDVSKQEASLMQSEGEEREKVKSSSEVQINSSSESIRTFALVQEDERKLDSDFNPPSILVQLDPEESQSSSSNSNSNYESENDGGSSSTASSSSQIDIEVPEDINASQGISTTLDSIHETQGSHGCHDDKNNEPFTMEKYKGLDERDSDGKLLDEKEEDGHEAGDGIINILNSLQECNLEEEEEVKEGIMVDEFGYKPDQCLCGHVCSDDRYRETLVDMIREETPDRIDLVTSIFCDDYNHKPSKSRVSFDEDDVSLEVNIRSPSLTANVCQLCHNEDINEYDEDDSTRQYRVIEEVELNKYELLDCEDDVVDEEDEDEKLGLQSDDEDRRGEEEGNLSSDLSTTVIIEEDSELALGASTDQEIDFLGRNVSFDRDELSTILLRDKRRKYADLRHQNSMNSKSQEKKRKVKKLTKKLSKESCSKKRKRRRRSVCGKLECSFCDLVNLTGREGDNDNANHEWNQLDSDTIKLMDILDKLSRVMAEKAKRLVNKRNQSQKRQNEHLEDDFGDGRAVQFRKKDQLQGLRDLGVMVKKVENRRRLLILKDDVSQYRIQDSTKLKRRGLKIRHEMATRDSLGRLLLDEDDVLSEVSSSKAVPEEVKEWLATTFTRTNTSNAKRRSEEKPKFRTVANAIRAGITVDKIYRRLCAATLIQIPAHISEILKGVDNWSFDVFALSEASNGQVLKYLGYDILNRYGFVHKFKIPQRKLDKFLNEMELGYTKYRNPYHNNLHAADVTQTVHYILYHLGFASWLTDLEIFATIIAAIIHDFQHTGTTNNFHVMSGSETAILYNDRAVLENFHISSAFKIILEEDANILQNLSKEEYREFRNLVIEMVLATDMSSHFQQIKTMKSLLAQNELIVDKAKGLSLIIHCCDISHPAKQFDIHQKWTGLLMEEFFRQGDKEKELGLQYSPLCDRNSTLVAESQIGFIDFIVAPSMEVCGELLDKIYHHIIGDVHLDPKKRSDQSDQKQKHSSKAIPSSAPENLKPIKEGLSSSSLGRPKSFSCINELQPSKRNVIGESEKISEEQKDEDNKASTEISDQRSIKSAPPPQSASSSSTSSSKFNSEVVKHIDPEGKIIRPWHECLEVNKARWKDRADDEAKKRDEKNKSKKKFFRGTPPPPPPRPDSASSKPVCDMKGDSSKNQ